MTQQTPDWFIIMLITPSEWNMLPKKGINLAHININSLRNKLCEIESLLSKDNVYILALTETHLDSTFDDCTFDIQGYNFYRKDRNEYGGGVAFYVRETLPVRIRTDLMMPNLEVLWLQIQIPHLRPLLVSCCYRPPDSDTLYLDKVCEMLDKSSISGYEVYFMGDLNIDWASQNCPLKNKLSDAANICGLTQVIDKPTRICLRKNGHRSSTCIDHVFTNAPELCSASLSIPVGYSDHNLIIVNRSTKLTKTGPKMIYKRSYKSFKEDQFIDDVKNNSWSKIYSKTDPEEALEEFTETFMKLVEKHAPLKKFVVRSTRTPWLDREIKDCMKKRDNAKRTAIITGNQCDWIFYKQLRNSVTKLNRDKKKIYYEKQINKVKTNNRKLWDTVNHLLGRNKNASPAFLDVGSNFLTEANDIAEYLNMYFENKVTNLKKSLPNNQTNGSLVIIKENIMNGKKCSFKFKPVSISELKDILKEQKCKPPGIDGLDNKLLKLVIDEVTPVLCHILNLSLSSRKFPTAWKKAKIIPIPKNKSASFSCSNSRPISLLPLLSKIMEKVVCNQIKQYFLSNGLLTDQQHAYRRGHSTATALTQMVDDWYKQIDQQNIVGAVMLDFSAAFDLLNHQLLLDKLRCYGFDVSSTQWLKSYLTNRTQSVFFNGCYSASTAVTCGVPQGSCLGPLLYNIFTNDLPFILKNATAVMYADDSTVYSCCKSIEELNLVLNKELKSVVDWVQQNQLVLNVVKTSCMVIGTRHSLSKNPELILMVGNEFIKQVQETKLLGVTIDNKLTWEQHVNKMCVKMGGVIASIKRCAPFLGQKVLKQLTQSLLLSNLDYCPTVWSNAKSDMIDKLQKIQNRAARLVLKRDYRANVREMHKDLTWLFVKDRLLYSLLTFVWNVSKTQTPFKIYINFEFSKDKHDYNTRHAVAGKFTFPKVRSQAIKCTAVYRGMYEWNQLPKQLSEICCRTTFKTKLKQYICHQY